MRASWRVAVLALGWALLVSSAGAYTHYLHYTSKTAPYLPVPEKLDLAALPNKTVNFFVSDAGPSQFMQYDGLPSVLAQVRQAAQAWDGVATSDLRVSFGGLYADGTAGVTPGGEVVFDDEVPPGLLAITTHTAANNMVTRADGSFFPITRSLIHFRSDLTQAPGPSYTDDFYLTVVHEMGHALGLQHTFTSSVMSTAVTRATSAMRPLDADDIAAISLLYPRNFPGQSGTITGTVTTGKQGVHMASVVALRANGPAISALTQPDGAYRIDGVPPGNYFLYVQPLPPTANITSPKDADGHSIDPTGPFDGEFYPSGNDPTQATIITVHAGASNDGINFAVNRRGAVPVYDVATYSYFGQSPVHPAYVSIIPGSATIAASGTGLGANGQAAPGLGASIIGSSFIAAGGVRAYGSTPTYLALDVRFTIGTSPGPQHLVFSQGNGLYVLPAGMKLVNRDPPTINSVSTDTGGDVLVTGSHFANDSQIYFDGVPAFATIVDDSHATVIPPPGAGNQSAVVTVYNSDGQNSTFTAPAALPTYSYGATSSSNNPTVTFSPTALPAGARAMIDVTGVNTNFVDGFMSVGFGSSDVLVERVWVLSPTHLLLNVQIPSNAQPAASYATVISGFQVIAQPGAFQILAANPNLPVVQPSLINGVWAPSGVFPGSTASMFGQNLGGAQANISIGGQQVTILSASQTQINFTVPAALQPGPAVLRLNNGSAKAYPVVISIDPVPPTITAVQDSSKNKINASNPANPGDLLNLLVTGLATSGPGVRPTRVHVTVGGLDIPAGSVSAANNSTFVVQFKLDPSVTAGAQIPVTVSIDGKTSLPVYIPINSPPSTPSGN